MNKLKEKIDQAGIKKIIIVDDLICSKRF